MTLSREHGIGSITKLTLMGGLILACMALTRPRAIPEAPQRERAVRVELRSPGCAHVRTAPVMRPVDEPVEPTRYQQRGLGGPPTMRPMPGYAQEGISDGAEHSRVMRPRGERVHVRK